MTISETFSTDLAEFPNLDKIMYLTGVSTQDTRDAQRADLGYLVTPASDKLGTQCSHYDYFGADNGCFVESKSGKPFNAERWLAWLSKLDVRRCLFAALPDVLNWITDPETGAMFPVGDFEATIERSAKYVDVVRDMGFPTALVAQDGLVDLDVVPFHVDALFIGGSDDYKLGPDAAAVTAQARRRGLWVHMGRVNSKKRLAYANSIGCDSADGTFLKFCRKADQRAQFERMVGWLEAVGSKPEIV